MDFFPFSKSGYSQFLLCPWHAHARKNLGLHVPSSLAAEIGTEKHLWTGEILLGNVSVDHMLETVGEDISTDVLAALDQHSQSGIPTNTAQLVEAYFCVDINGVMLSTDPDDIPDGAVCHGFEDLIVLLWEDATTIKDWKFGTYEKDDPAERHTYVLGARAMQPDQNRFRFIRHFPKSGNQYVWLYEFDDDGTVTISESGKTRRKKLRGQPNGLIEWMQAIARKIQATPPDPKPGSHCQNWYGQPCAFFGLECPETSGRLPVPVRSIFDELDANDAFAMLRSMIAEPRLEKRDKHYQAIAPDGTILSEGWSNRKDAQQWIKTEYAPAQLARITPDMARWAMSGNQRLAEFTKRMEKKLKEWAKVYGDIQVGDAKFGWRSKSKSIVDEVYALRTMLEQGMPLEAICKAVNISRSSLEKIPAEFAETRDLLLEMAVEKGATTDDFGEIKEK